MSDERARTMGGVDDADALVRLLSLSEPRPAVSSDRAARVKGAVHTAWRDRARRRARRRRSGASLMATAAAALVAVRVGVFDWPAPLPTEPVAVVERIEGSPRRTGSDGSGPLAGQDRVRAGEWIETGVGARVALRFSDGTSVRLDRGTRARPLSAASVELVAGALYVDTEREPGRFEVRTPIATARDIGTQFELRLVDAALLLRVRTGMVELDDRGRVVSARAGTEIRFSRTGAVSRPIPVHGAEWDWTARVAPARDIEGQPLVVYLDGVAREHGWRVDYATPALRRQASRIVLHGSVAGLPPDQAVAVAVATSGLRHRLEDGVLTVLPGDAGSEVPGGGQR